MKEVHTKQLTCHSVSCRRELGCCGTEHVLQYVQPTPVHIQAACLVGHAPGGLLVSQGLRAVPCFVSSWLWGCCAMLMLTGVAALDGRGCSCLRTQLNNGCNTPSCRCHCPMRGSRTGCPRHPRSQQQPAGSGAPAASLRIRLNPSAHYCAGGTAWYGAQSGRGCGRALEGRRWAGGKVCRTPSSRVLGRGLVHKDLGRSREQWGIAHGTCGLCT